MKNWRNWVLLVGLVLVLGVINFEIVDKRSTLANGKSVLLALRPVDPRSLIQGDFMELAFDDPQEPDAATIAGMSFTGTIVMRLDENGVGHFARPDDGGELQPGELRIRYRRHKEWTTERISYTARSYFFQEGLAERYAAAKYAIVKVDESGASVLVDLADENRQPINDRAAIP